MRFSYRRYIDGDADAINTLFFKVKGQRRSLEQYHWQWSKSPGGESEIWLIEAELENGEKKIIGHHGVMAEQFTYEGKFLRVGKTENTMVLPEYREKILYPRYEKLFFDAYEHKFHALFTTMGSNSAVRIRNALGYESKYYWTNLYLGRDPALSWAFFKTRLLGNREKIEEKIKNLFGLHRVNGADLTLGFGPDLDFDYDGFWGDISLGYGLTPSRTQENLCWRFWSNPYRQHYTIKVVSPFFGIAICVFSIIRNGQIYLEDIFCENQNGISDFSSTLYKWFSREFNGILIGTTTTSDCLQIYKGRFFHEDSALHRIFINRQAVDHLKMPRLVTKNGLSVGLTKDSSWFVTPFVFEGI